MNSFFTYLSKPCHNHQHCILLLYGIIPIYCFVHKKRSVAGIKDTWQQTVQRGLKNDQGYIGNYKRRHTLRLDCVEQTQGYKISSQDISRYIESIRGEPQFSRAASLKHEEVQNQKPVNRSSATNTIGSSHRDMSVPVSQVLPFRVIKNGSSWWFRQHSLVTKHGNSVESDSLKDC